MYRICCLDKIAGAVLPGTGFALTDRPEDAHAVLVRSRDLHNMALPAGLLTVARAGAGVNNIPVEACTAAGIVVFRTPGANANAVAELALCGMLLGCRDVAGGIEWVKTLCAQGNVAALVEREKARFAGIELRGRTLGVVGLGAVGGRLAVLARQLGMTVCGYDPYRTCGPETVQTLEELLGRADFVSLHAPLTDSTRNMIGAAALSRMKPGAVLLNFARGELVDDDALAAALAAGRLRRYVTDFPNDKTARMPGVVAIPHLGASTAEAEENCARMAVKRVADYLENGTIADAVNFPDCDPGPCTGAARIAVLHRSVPEIPGILTGAVADLTGVCSAVRGEYACTVLDLARPVPPETARTLQSIPNVLRVRTIPQKGKDMQMRR